MSVVLSVYPITISRGDLVSGGTDETVDKFLAGFNYSHLEPYVDLASQGNTVTIEVLVDFPWQLLMSRHLEPTRVKFSGLKADSGDWYRPRVKENTLQPKENFRAASRDAFFQFGGRALEAMEATPLKGASMFIEGFGERRSTGKKEATLNVQIVSEYGVHTLPYGQQAKERFNRDLNALVALGGDWDHSNPVLDALRWIDKQEDGGNLEFIPYNVELLPNLMSCSLSEIYITLNRASRQQGRDVLYVAAYDGDNRAHKSRFDPDKPFAQAIEPAMEKLLIMRLGKHVFVRSDFL